MHDQAAGKGVVAGVAAARGTGKGLDGFRRIGRGRHEPFHGLALEHAPGRKSGMDLRPDRGIGQPDGQCRGGIVQDGQDLGAHVRIVEGRGRFAQEAPGIGRQGRGVGHLLRRHGLDRIHGRRGRDWRTGRGSAGGPGQGRQHRARGQNAARRRAQAEKTPAIYRALHSKPPFFPKPSLSGVTVGWTPRDVWATRRKRAARFRRPEGRPRAQP